MESVPLSVLIITVDNLRPDRMSVYGYEKNTTPYLRRFATESAVFDRAFSTSAWTAPGMVSIFTGYYPPVHAQHGRFSFYDEEMNSALKLLVRNGYETFGQAIRGPSHQGFGLQKRLGKRPDQLGSFIEERSNNFSPFFAWAHLTDVHLPYDPSPASAARFNANVHESVAIRAVREHRIILRDPEDADPDLVHAGKVSFGAKDVAVVRALYDAEVADVDLRLQRYLERMRETGLLDRTIVILTADHGEELFEHGWLGHASTGYDAKLYDELIRVPLIIRIPGLMPRGHFDVMVQGVDLMPTIFELLEIDPISLKPAMQGRSFLPVIEGKTRSIREYVFNQTSLKGWTTPREELRHRIVSVRSEDKKLIYISTPQGKRVEAYDLRRDPGELLNLYPGDRARFIPLERELDAWNIENRSLAAELVMDGAWRRIQQIAGSLLRNDMVQAVAAWSAIQTMEETWSLEPDPFFRVEPHASEWSKIRRIAAGMIGAGMNCISNGGKMHSKKPAEPVSRKHWSCELPP